MRPKSLDFRHSCSLTGRGIFLPSPLARRAGDEGGGVTTQCRTTEFRLISAKLPVQAGAFPRAVPVLIAPIAAPAKSGESRSTLTRSAFSDPSALHAVIASAHHLHGLHLRGIDGALLLRLRLLMIASARGDDQWQGNRNERLLKRLDRQPHIVLRQRCAPSDRAGVIVQFSQLHLLMKRVVVRERVQH